MYFYIARQAILNRDKSMYGYELLFRNGANNAFPDISPDVATASLIENSQFQFNVADITQQRPAFINFTEQSILDDLPSVMPKETIVVEVLESVTPSASVFQCLRSLKERGYSLALDDYEFNPAWDEVLDIIDIIKVDLRASSRAQILGLTKNRKQHQFKLLAEKVETYEEFQMCLDDGFDYFQGYFFSKPEMLQKRALTPNQMVYMQLLQACANDTMDFNQISRIMASDLGLSYKLLRYVNAPLHATSRRIESLRQAVIFLGEQEIKKFVAVITAAQLGEHKPSELIRLSVVRARMCELLAKASTANIDVDKAFLTGMFSMLEAILDEPLKTIVARIDLSADIQEALLEQKGPLAYCLAITLFYERANWARVKTLTERLGINEDELPAIYRDALNWANALDAPTAKD